MSSMSRPLASVIPAGVTHIPSSVTTFSPTTNELTTSNGDIISEVSSPFPPSH